MLDVGCKGGAGLVTWLVSPTSGSCLAWKALGPKVRHLRPVSLWLEPWPWGVSHQDAFGNAFRSTRVLCEGVTQNKYYQAPCLTRALRNAFPKAFWWETPHGQGSDLWHTRPPARRRYANLAAVGWVVLLSTGSTHKDGALET